ncbi:CPBP family intramembrane metalloprotease domain-containing protein, partial [Synechococcus sp. AH-551-G15]|nr:CPBP family intramembrane metalloprotease domain-containing protein [Synechococcus sp. AH-551-G15]
MTSPPNGRSNAVPKWKVLLAVVSMVLACSVWFLGLMDSLGRSSVAPALSLEQQELALLAEPALTPSLKPLLIGQDPAQSLLETLRETPLDSLNDRQTLLFASLENDPGRRKTLLETPLQTPNLRTLQETLATEPRSLDLSSQEQELLSDNSPDPLTRRLVCQALGGAQSDCVDSSAAKAAARRLVLSELMPLGALLLGSLLLVRQLWLLLRRKQSSWPELQAP